MTILINELTNKKTMKQILIATLILTSVFSFGQTPTATLNDAKTYINANIKSNGLNSITGAKLNTAMTKLSNAVMGTVDSLGTEVKAVGIDVSSISSTVSTHTGQISTINGQISTINSSIASLIPLPSQSGQSGKYLSTDGSNLSWQAASGGVPYTGATGDVNLGSNNFTAAIGTFNNFINTSGGIIVGNNFNIIPDGGGLMRWATGSGAIVQNFSGVGFPTKTVTWQNQSGTVAVVGTTVNTFLNTPTSANLLAALTTKTGTGNAVFGTLPTLAGFNTPQAGTTATDGWNLGTGQAIFRSTATAITITGSKLMFDFTNTTAGTTGNQTINKPSGSVNIATGGSSITVTNSLVNAASKVFATIATTGMTISVASISKNSGSFTVTLTGVTSSETIIDFFVIN
jgi:hypothetical protein